MTGVQTCALPIWIVVVKAPDSASKDSDSGRCTKPLWCGSSENRVGLCVVQLRGGWVRSERGREWFCTGDQRRIRCERERAVAEGQFILARAKAKVQLVAKWILIGQGWSTRTGFLLCCSWSAHAGLVVQFTSVLLYDSVI